MDGFSRFWQWYPKKDAKKDARKAWDKLAPSETLTDTIVQAVIAQDQYRKRQTTRRQWVPEWPLPATWIRGERWTDETPKVGAVTVERSRYGTDEERDLV